MIVSPQAALFSVCCNAVALLTFQICPFAGVFASVVCKKTRGSCAGPSMEPVGCELEIVRVND
jgi:hypothetical protein